jgi:hypothetical protein
VAYGNTAFELFYQCFGDVSAHVLRMTNINTTVNGSAEAKSISNVEWNNFFIGLKILMSCIHLANKRSYWGVKSDLIEFPNFCKFISYDRYLQISSYGSNKLFNRWFKETGAI